MKKTTKKNATKKKAAAAPSAGEKKLKRMIAAKEGERINVELIVALVIQDLTDLVTVDDSGAQPTVTPDDLFMRTFDDPLVGLDNDQLEFFKTNLAAALPMAASDIALIAADATADIRTVTDFVKSSVVAAGFQV